MAVARGVVGRAGVRRAGRPLRTRVVAGVGTAQGKPQVSKRFDDTRTALRLGIPSKGRMAEDTQDLLAACQLKVRKVNPRQYIAKMPQFDNLEVWFQRATDVVRKIRYGDIDLGIVGYDMLAELGEGDEDLLVVHDALDFGQCHLAVAVPNTWDTCTSLEDLKNMGWTEERPLRILTGYLYLAEQYFTEKGFKHFELSTADGALEAAPVMGTADVILDLVSSGTTLKENNLKQIEGGKVVESQAVLVASKQALLKRPGLLEIVHEMLERLEAHLRAQGQFLVTANVRGTSAEEVAEKLFSVGGTLSGLQGPTVSPIYTKSGGSVSSGEFFAVNVAVTKAQIYDVTKLMRSIGGSGVLVLPLTYIFDEEPPRWRALLDNLGLQSKADLQH